MDTLKSVELVKDLQIFVKKKIDNIEDQHGEWAHIWENIFNSKECQNPDIKEYSELLKTYVETEYLNALKDLYNFLIKTKKKKIHIKYNKKCRKVIKMKKDTRSDILLLQLLCLVTKEDKK